MCIRDRPYIGENVLLVRWFFVYLLPLTIGASLGLDFLWAEPERRSRAALVGIAITVLPAILASRAYYDAQPYDPTPLAAADRGLRNGGIVPVIASISPGAEHRRNDGLTAGLSDYPCYEPVFGYRLESFPLGLRVGPLSAGGASLRNPACYLYGPANGCAPGDIFAASQTREAAAFAGYQSFAFVVPGWQTWANAASAIGGIAILLGLGLAAVERCRAFVARRSSGGPLRYPAPIRDEG